MKAEFIPQVISVVFYKMAMFCYTQLCPSNTLLHATIYDS